MKTDAPITEYQTIKDMNKGWPYGLTLENNKIRCGHSAYLRSFSKRAWSPAMPLATDFPFLNFGSRPFPPVS